MPTVEGRTVPVEALRRWLRSNVEFVATKKGMAAALALAVNSSSELSAYSFERLTKAVGALLDRAVAAGEIRADISPEDLLRALVGMCYMHDSPAGRRACCACSTFSSTVCANGPKLLNHHLHNHPPGEALHFPPSAAHC